MSSTDKIEIPTPEGLNLKPYQELGVLNMLGYILGNNKNGNYNADEQGLGKTVQSVASLNLLISEALLPPEPKVLVLAPKSMIYTWEDEINTWSTYEHKIGVITKRTQFESVLSDNNIVITTHGLAKGKKGVLSLSRLRWDLLIIDESHVCQNPKAAVTKALLGPIWNACTYKIALSGTPIKNNVVGGFPMFNALDPIRFPDFYAFANMYAYRKETPWGTKFIGLRNHKELREAIRSSFFFRRKKDEVLPELPDKTFQRIVLPPEYHVNSPENELENVEALFKEVKRRFEEGNDPPTVTQLSSLAGIRREQGMRKIKPIAEFVQELLDQDMPVVLFCYHRSVIQEYIKAFRKITPAIIDGSTSTTNRHLAVKRFQEGGTDLFIGQIKAAGTGITLTRASVVVLAELDWNPDVISQAVDRVHRIGQKDAVNIYYFTVKDSIDNDLVETVIKKAKDIAKIVENDYE